jgi:lipoate---protein ligase
MLTSLAFDLISSQGLPALLNAAVDEVLLYRVAQGRRRPLLWMRDWSEPAIVIGSYQSVGNEIDRDALHHERFTFVRRVSGGGAMIVEPENTVTYSLIVPEAALDGLSFRASFELLDAWCVSALRSLGIPAEYKPINDIASPSGKIAGAAQCRRNKTVLHHTAMAYAFDNDRMMRLLRLNRPVLNPRGIPSAVKLVTPVSMFAGQTQTEVRERLISFFAKTYATEISELRADELDEAELLVKNKFGAREWLYRVP